MSGAGFCCTQMARLPGSGAPMGTAPAVGVHVTFVGVASVCVQPAVGIAITMRVPALPVTTRTRRNKPGDAVLFKERSCRQQAGNCSSTRRKRRGAATDVSNVPNGVDSGLHGPAMLVEDSSNPVPSQDSRRPPGNRLDGACARKPLPTLKHGKRILGVPIATAVSSTCPKEGKSPGTTTEMSPSS